MHVGLLGTGTVGETLGSAFVGLDHVVCMGSRSTPNDRAQAWVAAQGDTAGAGTFAEAFAVGDVVFKCTCGAHSLEALRVAGADALAGKVPVDVANPLDFSDGSPPRLAVVGDDSLAGQIQLAFALTQVVKAPVIDLLTELGWSRGRVRDLGGVAAARATEMYLMLWVSLMGAVGSAQFNVRVVATESSE